MVHNLHEVIDQSMNESHLYLEEGIYELYYPLDAQGLSITGDHIDKVKIVYKGNTGYAIDQMINGATDGGRCSYSNFTLESNANGIRTFGDGHSIKSVKVTSRLDAVTLSLPIMCTLQQVYAHNCGGYGFVVTAHPDVPSMIGTSLYLNTCWAYRCGKSGFKITTIAYSTISNSCSQECGFKGVTEQDKYGWQIVGNVNGEGVHSGMSLHQIATEGDNKGLFISNVRNLDLNGLKVVTNAKGPNGSLMFVGNAGMSISNVRLQTPNNKLDYHFEFMPDPNNSNWIWDSTGRDGAIVLFNSRLKVKPFNADVLDQNVLKRFELLASNVH